MNFGSRLARFLTIRGKNKMAESQNALAKKYGMSRSGIRTRLARGIPLDQPKKYKPGGHWTIDKPKAEAIWQDVKAKKAGECSLTYKQIAEKHEVTQQIVENMARGYSWNDVTGIPYTRPKYEY